MRNFGKWMVVVGLAALLAGPAMAQGQGKGQGKGRNQGKGGQGQGRGRGMGGAGGILLANASVQTEIKATDEQKEKITELTTKQGEKMRDLFQGGGFDQAKMTELRAENNKEADKLAKEILKPDQLKRYNEIAIQDAGVMAFARDDVVTTLKLTADQKDKLKALGQDYQKDLAELMPMRGGGGGGANFQELAQKRTALKKDFMTKAEGVLTADQKAKWKDLVGKEFTVVQPAFGGGGGRRGQNKDKDK